MKLRALSKFIICSKDTHILLLFRHFIGKILRAKEIEFMAAERRDATARLTREEMSRDSRSR